MSQDVKGNWGSYCVLLSIKVKHLPQDDGECFTFSFVNERIDIFSIKLISAGLKATGEQLGHSDAGMVLSQNQHTPSLKQRILANYVE